MSIGRNPEQAAADQRQRDRDNLELRNQRRSGLRLPPLTMREFLAERGRENQQYVREQVLKRESALAQALGGLLRDRSDHVRDCPPRRTGRSPR